MIKDQNTGELVPDERFMRSIEEQIGITEASAKVSADVTAYVFRDEERRKLNYSMSHSRKLSKKLTASVREPDHYEGQSQG